MEWADGRRDAVVFALEEESDWRRFSPRRLARYCLDIADMYDTNRVVPVTIFLRTAERAPASLVLGTERCPYLVFKYVACKLAEMPAERWLDSGNLVARLNLPNMQSGAHDPIAVYHGAVRGLLALEPEDAKRAKARPGGRDLKFIDIYAGLTDNRRGDPCGRPHRLYRQQHPEEGRIVTGVFQRAHAAGIELGIERGIERGIEQGRAEGERAVLERLLRRRFGQLPPEAAERLRRAPEAELEIWADNVLDAGTLDEVFRTAT